MPAPYTDLDFKAEDLLREYILRTDDPGVPVYRTFDAEEFASPVAKDSVAIIATNFERTVPEVLPSADVGYGNQTISLAVRIRTSIDPEKFGEAVVATAREKHARLRGRIMDLLHRDTILTDLAGCGVPGIGCYRIDWATGTRRPMRAGLMTTINVEMLVYGKEG